MKPSVVALLSAALLLGGTWVGHDTAGARETDWWVEEDVGAPSDVAPEPLDEFQAAIPSETGSLPPGETSVSGSEAGAASQPGQVPDPED